MPFGMTDDEFSKLTPKERGRMWRSDRPQIGVLVRWNRDRMSKDGRFMIEGLPEGTTRNVSYCLWDSKDGARNRKRIATCDSVRQCKVEAERICAAEQN